MIDGSSPVRGAKIFASLELRTGRLAHPLASTQGLDVFPLTALAHPLFGGFLAGAIFEEKHGHFLKRAGKGASLNRDRVPLESQGDLMASMSANNNILLCNHKWLDPFGSLNCLDKVCNVFLAVDGRLARMGNEVLWSNPLDGMPYGNSLLLESSFNMIGEHSNPFLVEHDDVNCFSAGDRQPAN